MAAIGTFVVWAILFVFNLLVRGFALCDIWSWYVVPFGVQPIVFWQALGISCAALMFTITISTKKQEKTFTEIAGLGLFTNLMLWGMAGLYHWAWVNNFLGLN